MTKYVEKSANNHFSQKNYINRLQASLMNCEVFGNTACCFTENILSSLVPNNDNSQYVYSDNFAVSHVRNTLMTRECRSSYGVPYVSHN